uniref:Protein NEDD1 n=1 Tax=Glossina morsitans morsitans TaxID=37546 RepID=A0A1B0FQS4_GLOMM
MYLISTARTTVLTSFQDLDVKCTYQHSNGENTDFQFYTQQRIFVEVNKKSGLELMRIREKVNESISIQRVRKLTIDNVYCVACAKQSVEEIAVGLSNGQVKLYNYKNSEFIHKFSADTNRNSVLYLDYNASDEYIAGVFECGLINVYGHKTKTKVDSFNIDGHSTLARFHPSKRFQLSIASYKGTVTLYDIQAKRKLFNASDAHAAPCRDLCISPGAPDTLISVGYDCLINIFDMRRKVKPLQINYCHPLSTVAVSECGTYFCTGNLKGEIITNDMRNLKSFLSSKKIHDCGVTRVAFAPTSADNSSYSTSSLVAASSDISLSGLGVKENELRKSLTSNAVDGARCQRDSFCDFLDYQINRGEEKNSSRLALRSDSFDWESLSHKSHPDINRSFEHLTTNNDICDFKANTSDFLKVPLKDRNNISLHTNAGKLAQIKEEEKHIVDLAKYVDSGSEKENPQTNDTNLSSNRSHAPIACNSTPNREHASMDDVLTATKPQCSSTTNNTPNNTPASLEEQERCVTPVPDANVFKAISDLRQEMLQRFHHLEFEVKLMIENNKWQIFTQNFSLWNQNLEQTEQIRDCLAALLQTDPFVNELLRLKDENELLKQQLKDFLNK